MIARPLLAAVLLAASLAGPARAQVPYRGGPWLDVGFGYGSLRLVCDSCAPATEAGSVLTVSAGGAPTRNVLLGLEGQIWFSTASGPGETVHTLTAIVQWYPWEASGFFVRAGTGVVRGPVVPEIPGEPQEQRQGTGVGLEFAAGYDLPVSRRFGLTLQAGWHVAALGDVKLQGRPGTANDLIAYVTRIGVAAVFR